MAQQRAAVELADVIDGLRNELEVAQEKGEGRNLRFGVKDIELELELTVAKEAKATGKATAGVDLEKGVIKYIVGKVKGDISLEGSGTYKKVSTQKVKLNLSVENADGSSSKLSTAPR